MTSIITPIRAILVFTGGDAPAPEGVAPFFAKSERPRIFVADSGLLAAEAYCQAFAWPTGASGRDGATATSGAAGLIEGILGDFDSLDEARLAPYPARLIERHPKDKDDSDTELALGAAHAARQASGGDAATAPIILIGGCGGRIDHLFAIERLFSCPRAPDLWLTPVQAIHCLGAGHRASLTFANLSTDDCISVFPVGMGEGAVGKEQGARYKVQGASENLFWPLDAVNWADGSYSLSNRPAHDGSVTVTALSGRFLVCAPLIPSG
jgi:thiamine pyrophosphokinase